MKLMDEHLPSLHKIADLIAMHEKSPVRELPQKQAVAVIDLLHDAVIAGALAMSDSYEGEEIDKAVAEHDEELNALECLREAVIEAEKVPDLYLPETVERWRKAAKMANSGVTGTNPPRVRVP